MTETEIADLIAQSNEVYESGATANQPTNAALNALVVLGNIYAQRGETDEARDHWLRAAKCGDLNATSNLLSLYANLYFTESEQEYFDIDRLDTLAQSVRNCAKPILKLYATCMERHQSLDTMGHQTATITAEALHEAATVFDRHWRVTHNFLYLFRRDKEIVSDLLAMTEDDRATALEDYSSQKQVALTLKLKNSDYYFSAYDRYEQTLVTRIEEAFNGALSAYEPALDLYERLAHPNLNLTYRACGQLCDLVFQQLSGTKNVNPFRENAREMMLAYYNAGARRGDAGCQFNLGLYLWENQPDNPASITAALDLILTARSADQKLQDEKLPDDLAAVIKRKAELNRSRSQASYMMTSMTLN